MGARTGHYLLHFALQAKGQAWIDRHVHTFMPVGGPLLGASSSLSSVVCGSKMGLPDAFLSDHGALLFGRSLGSTPWLLPTNTEGKIEAALEKDTFCSSAVVKQGMICLRLETLDVRKLHQTSPNLSRLRIGLKFQGQLLKSRWVDPSPVALVRLDEVFEFPTAWNWKGGEHMQVVLYEKGLAMEGDRKKVAICRCGSCYDCCCSIVCCPCCCVIHLSEYILDEFYHASKQATNQALAVSGSGVKIREAKLRIDAVAAVQQVNVTLYNTGNYSSRYRRDGSVAELKMQFSWKRHDQILAEERIQSTAATTTTSTLPPFARDLMSPRTHLLPLTSSQLMIMENLDTLQHLWTGAHYQENPFVSAK